MTQNTANQTEIRTNKRRNPYVMIDNAFFEDTQLSWKSKGLMGYLLSRPDNWKINHKDLVNRAKDGKDSVTAALTELQNAGYIHYFQERGERGKFGKWIYEVYETPEDNPHYSQAGQGILPHPENPLTVEKPYPVKPYPEKPYPENPDYNYNNLSNKDLNNNQKDKQEEEEERAGARIISSGLFEKRQEQMKPIEESWYAASSCMLNPIQAETIRFFIEADKCEVSMIVRAIEETAKYSNSKAAGGKFRYFEAIMMDAMNNHGIRTEAEFMFWRNNVQIPQHQQAAAAGYGFQQNNRNHKSNNNYAKKKNSTEILRDMMDNGNKTIYEIMREPF